MFKSCAPLLYVKLSPDLVTVRNVKTGAEVAEVPELAISRVSGRTEGLSVSAVAQRCP